MPAFWGRGLATEMAGASIAVAIERLQVDSLVAIALPGNRASRRVMEKLGMGYEREVSHAGLAHVLYRLTAAQWFQTRRA
jgi:RimJ/RimL family protein N-acetyltransferase